MQTKLKKYLEEQNLDGLLLIGDSVSDPDMLLLPVIRYGSVYSTCHGLAHLAGLILGAG